jgi:hypothetical protein
MIAIAVACWATGARAEPLPTQPYLTIDVALRAATAALDKCKAEGHAVSVEVMNQSAMTLVALHDPFTTIHSAYSAHAKAYTVLSYSFASGYSRLAVGARRGAYQGRQNHRRCDWRRRIIRRYAGRKVRLRRNRGHQGPLDAISLRPEFLRG